MSDSESSSSSPPNSGLDWDHIETTITNARIAEDKKKWLDVVEKYVAETRAVSLDLSSKGIGVEEAKLIFRSLQNSQVTELNLANNNLSGGMGSVVQMLLSTKIRKLDIYDCSFSKGEMLHLMATLKNSHVTKLVFWNDDKSVFSLEERNHFVSHLLESRLTFLDFNIKVFDPERNGCYIPCGIRPFLQVLSSTPITNLSLSGFLISKNDLSKDVLVSLFSNLSHTVLTDLSLQGCDIDEENAKKLSVCLRDSKLISLDLSNNCILDAGIDALAVGLVCSKITTLNLSQVSANGSNALGLCLKDSQIETVYLSFNHVDSDMLFSFPDFLRHSSLVTLEIDNSGLDDELGQVLMRSLKFSKITKLNVSCNDLQLLSALEFANVIKDTDITDVDLSWNLFPFSGIVALGDCLKDSKLKRIRLGNSPRCRTDLRAVSIFLEKTKESTVESVYIVGNHSCANIDKTIVDSSLINTAFAHFSLVWHVIEDDAVVSLAKQLKFTAITHLVLSCTNLGDAGVVCLATCLNETQIVDLDISHNCITNYGAKALSAILNSTSLLHLNLAHNKIENEGFEALAQHAEGTFVTVLGLSGNPGTRNLLVDRILLENKIFVHRFLGFFKRIAPETSADSFHLDESVENANVDVFLEECLQFYKTVIEQSSAVSVLVEAEGFLFSRGQVVSLCVKEFPRQFATFIINRIEATATQHINFLKRVEELGLNKIVELLLLNRPALMIDRSVDILHPYAYQLLHKYRQPLYNSSIEPNSKMKIINYFSKHSNIEGAVDVINLVHSYNK